MMRCGRMPTWSNCWTGKVRVRVVYRKESEALVRDVVGHPIRDFAAPDSIQAFDQAFEAALRGDESMVLPEGVADEGFTFWGRRPSRRRQHCSTFGDCHGPGQCSARENGKPSTRSMRRA